MEKFSFTNTLVLSCVGIMTLLICYSIALTPLKNLTNGVRLNNYQIINFSLNSFIIFIVFFTIFSATIKNNIIKIIEKSFNGIINIIERLL